jgi:hypothetical protein
MREPKKRKRFEVDRNPSRNGETRQFNIKISSPMDGRPTVLWADGSTSGRIIEFWPYCEQQPVGQISRACRYSFNVIRKYVVYDRTSPQIRAVLLVDKPRKKDGEDLQPILGRRLEWDGPLGKAEVKKALGLVDEIARIERRGRPRGTGHPKQTRLELRADSSQKHFWDTLTRSGLSDKDIKLVQVRLAHKTEVEAAGKLGISPQAVNQKLKAIDAKLRTINPDFSLRSYLRLPERAGDGHRSGARLMGTDEFGTPYVRDVSQEIERRYDGITNPPK